MEIPRRQNRLCKDIEAEGSTWPGQEHLERANEGERNCWSNIPKEQKEAFSRALAHKTSYSI